MKSVKLLLLAVFVLSACERKTFDTKSELVDFIADEDNGLKYTKNVNGVDYTLQYRPTDLIVNQEAEANISASQIRALRNQYSKYLFFILSMSKNDKELLTSAASDRSRFGKAVNELAFGMSDKVHLYTEEKDTIEMVDYVYPRMFGQSNDTSLMLVFEKKENALKGSHLNFSIEDLGFRTGEVRFKIETKAILDEPKIDFKK